MDVTTDGDLILKICVSALGHLHLGEGNGRVCDGAQRKATQACGEHENPTWKGPKLDSNPRTLTYK